MATTGVVNGTLLRAYSGANVVAKATNSTLSITRETRETVHKDNPGNGWSEAEPGRKSGSLTVEALYGEDGANNNPDDLFTALDDGTSLTMKLSTEVTGDTLYSFSAYCTSYEINAPVEENSSYSATFTITGQVTKSTVA